MNEPVLSLRGVRAAYGRREVVRGVDLDVGRGQVIAIVGPNGCGKSTLLRVIARAHRPSAGQVTAFGRDVWELRPRHSARLIGLLPQDTIAPEGVSVAGLVSFGRLPHQGPFRQWSEADEAAVREAIGQTGLGPIVDERVDQLSGGQRQRAWIAMILAQRTPIVLLDEPISALDLGHQMDVLALMRSMAGNGNAVVTVLHDLAAAARCADVLVAMRDGVVLAAGPPAEVLTDRLVADLYSVEADVVRIAEGPPIVVPRARPAG